MANALTTSAIFENEDGSTEPAIDDNDANIIRILQGARPRLLKVTQIEAALRTRNMALSEGTIKQRLRTLADKKLILREGRRGVTLTEIGKEIATKPPAPI